MAIPKIFRVLSFFYQRDQCICRYVCSNKPNTKLLLRNFPSFHITLECHNGLVRKINGPALEIPAQKRRRRNHKQLGYRVHFYECACSQVPKDEVTQHTRQQSRCTQTGGVFWPGQPHQFRKSTYPQRHLL